MSTQPEYRFYYQSSSHGWITLTQTQADELIAVLHQVAESGRAVVWTVKDTSNEYWDTTMQFLIGPSTPVRLDVMYPTGR